MAQFSVRMSDEEFELLERLCKETGQPRSRYAENWIRTGLYQEIGNRNQAAAWQKIASKKKNENSEDS
ncbi:MAG: hypothetical protein WBG70_24360 [Spirulinaceae cyanobacterium]